MKVCVRTWESSTPLEYQNWCSPIFKQITVTQKSGKLQWAVSTAIKVKKPRGPLHGNSLQELGNTSENKVSELGLRRHTECWTKWQLRSLPDSNFSISTSGSIYLLINHIQNFFSLSFFFLTFRPHQANSGMSSYLAFALGSKFQTPHMQGQARAAGAFFSHNPHPVPPPDSAHLGRPTASCAFPFLCLTDKSQIPKCKIFTLLLPIWFMGICHICFYVSSKTS